MMNFLFRCVTPAILLGACGWSPFAQADVRLPSVFNSHMVLQRDQTIPIWGWADEGEEITVTLGDKSAKETADENGKWRVRLPMMEAGGPHTIVVKGNNEVQLDDVMIGEVWVCSGQSNMEWPMTRTLAAPAEIAVADFPELRLFDVSHAVADKPQDDCNGEWKTCTPESVAHFSAVGFFFGRHLHTKLRIPVGLISTNWGGTRAEAWTSRKSLERDEEFAPILERAKEFDPKNPHQPSVLYNGMLAPVIPYGIRGAIWYQGESNVSRAQQYAKLFPTMIKDWRRSWGQQDFPFLYVQLAPFRYGKQDKRCCAELWEAQLKTLKLKNTGMAVTVDIGNVRDIHPRNKQEVGYRLALWAMAKTYGVDDLVYSGPLFKAQCMEDGQVRVYFTQTGSGLNTNDGQPPSHFEVCGEDHKFVPASAMIEGDTVVVFNEDIQEPVAVRYAWSDDAVPNLVNKEGLPASPFRSDNYKMVTDGNR